MSFQTQSPDVIIIGAGAAGLMCAIEAGKRGRKVLLLDHSKKPAEKIRISGGGRCNFTNMGCSPENFLSANPHFCKSALARYTQWDFIELIEKHGIAWHEKKLGQLFCDDSAMQIIQMLLDECDAAGVELSLATSVDAVAAAVGGGYRVSTSRGVVTAESLVIATGGLSIPKIGATRFGYEIARQFGLNVLDTRAALVPLTFTADLLARCKALSGLSVEASVACDATSFAEGLLFTHRGLSGPSILQISSYWKEGQPITVDLAAGMDAAGALKQARETSPRQTVETALSQLVPKRLASSICTAEQIVGKLAELSNDKLDQLAEAVNRWSLLPAGSEGYRTAEVTLGGVDTDELSSRTMEAKSQPGLYFIGEVVDVTGHLGGYNFQWAWASGHAAGQSV